MSLFLADKKKEGSRAPSSSSSSGASTESKSPTSRSSNYQPIYKLSHSAYSSDEWVVILQHSIGKRKNDFPMALQLQAEHLSTRRLHDSLVAGLDKVDCEALRGEIWKLICKVQSSKLQFSTDVYSKFLRQPASHHDTKIQKDIHRTRQSYCQDFALAADSGKNRLYNVLKAYAAYDPEIGYCQGMNFIAALLLSQIPSEEDAFWCLVHVMYEKGWRDIFNQSLNKTGQLLKDLSCYIKSKWPKLHRRFQSHEYLTMEAAFTSQIITLNIVDAPSQQIATRIFELFLVSGAQVIVDLCVGMLEC